MNVDVVGRIRPPVRGEGPANLDTDGQNKLTSRPSGVSFNFQQLFQPDVGTDDVYRLSVEPLVDLTVAGFNTCLVVTGESGAGKSYTVCGDGQRSVMDRTIHSLLAKTGRDDRYMYDSRVSVNRGGRLTIQMFEVYNEQIRDLLRPQSVSPDLLDVDENAPLGPFVRDLSTEVIIDGSRGTQVFMHAWDRRTQNPTDFGPSHNHSTVITALELSMQSGDNPSPNKSRFTLVVTPGIEKLAEDSSHIRLREGPTLSRSLLCLSQLTSALANQPYPDRVINYVDSRVTYMLREELGGNCKTRVLLCLKPHADSAVLTAALQFANQVSQVKNFPIVNDPFAQQLITQWRARVLHLQNHVRLGSGGRLAPGQSLDTQEELRRLQTENLTFRDKNERLLQKLDELQSKFGSLAMSKTDLSAQLLMTEEEKLKVSKTLVDMQIENNKLKEEAEEAKFDLTNRILQLENALLEKETALERMNRGERGARNNLAELENDRKELADEYITLKTNFLTANQRLLAEREHNEELSVELINLVNDKAALVRRLKRSNPNMHLDDPDAEIDRVRALVGKPSDKSQQKKDTDPTRHSLWGEEGDLFPGDNERDKMERDEDMKNLQKKMKNLQKELNDTRALARQRQKNISELNAQLIPLRSEKKNLETVNNHLQHKLKDINDEFRSRLVKYIEDVAVREDQLSVAAKNYKQRLEDTIHKHEELLVAYRELRQQMEDKGFDELDLGPDEHQLQLGEKELLTSHQKEISRLRAELAETTNELERLKLTMRMDDYKGDPAKSSRPGRGSDGSDLSDLRRQLVEFTRNTQEDLEMERARLMSKSSMLEQQVAELEAYIDSHLARYKDEIVRLRQMLGMNDAGGFDSPVPFASRSKNHRR